MDIECIARRVEIIAWLNDDALAERVWHALHGRVLDDREGRFRPALDVALELAEAGP